MDGLPHYTPAPPTKENLDYADLATFDMAETATPEGRAGLAAKILEASTKQGFFYVVNHGYTKAQMDRIFDIADIPFSLVDDAEKETYVAPMKKEGSYLGYKPRQFWHIAGGVRDQIEHYNMHCNVTRKDHPKALRPYLPEIEAFARHNHFDILHPLLRVLARGLELPEETLVKLHGFDAEGETFLRFMKYYPRSEADETKSGNVWLKGHTDFGTVTILYSQPVSALQILSPDGKWRWARHIENAIIINTGDALEWLSGGIYPATRHRVVQPPTDQQGYARLGVFYFAATDDSIQLAPIVHNAKNKFADMPTTTMAQWRQGRIKAYGQTELKLREDGSGIEEELINGVVMKHYN